jgi:hypothetical protein
MARPRKTILKSEVVKVRYTSTEKRLLRSFSDSAGITVSEYIRSKSLDHKLKNRLTQEEVVYLRVLIGMATNLNQIAKKVNMGEATNMLVSEILITINNQIQKFK